MKSYLGCLNILNNLNNRKRATRSFGFGTAMEVRPVRGSTSSWNVESYATEDRWKREWIEIASEEFRDIAERFLKFYFFEFLNFENF